MPDEDAATRVARVADQVRNVADEVRSIADKVINAGTAFNETRTRLGEVGTRLGDVSTNFATLSALVTRFGETIRVDLMERLDRLQDEQTKQRIEMEAAVRLLRDSSPAELLVRIRQLQDEIRALKEEKNRPPP